MKALSESRPEVPEEGGFYKFIYGHWTFGKICCTQVTALKPTGRKFFIYWKCQKREEIFKNEKENSKELFLVQSSING